MSETPRPHVEGIGGVSPNWYCSGGGGEEGLRQDLALLSERYGRLEAQLREKDIELEESQQALREERQLEVESLNSMKSGSERILEQKSQQVQQLHGAIRKLNEALRKKDQQLASIVSHNLRADGAFTEATADLSEMRLSLKHAEGDLSKERTNLQRMESQMQSVGMQNQRLEELVNQYRHEVQRKDQTINAQILKEESSERYKTSLTMEATDALNDASAHLTRLDNELGVQEAHLLTGLGAYTVCSPSVVRPGQRVGVTITSHSPVLPKLLGIENAHDFSEIRAVSNSGTEWRYEASFTAGSREGAAMVTVAVQNEKSGEVRSQALALVEGSGSGVDLSGTTFTPQPALLRLQHRCELLITPRTATGDLISTAFTSHARPTGKHVSPSRTPPLDERDEMPSAPIVQVVGGDIIAHVEKLSQFTHKLVIRPTAGKVTISVLDMRGQELASAAFTADVPKPDLNRTILDVPNTLTVGDRATAKVKLFDAKGFACPAPSPSQLIKYYTGSSEGGDATDLGEELFEIAAGEYGFHFVPLSVGSSTINIVVGEKVRRAGRVSVNRAGGVATERFDIVLDPPSGCISVGSNIKCTVLFFDADGLPAKTAPPTQSLLINVSDEDVFRTSQITPDPSIPGGLTFTFNSKWSGSTEVQISSGSESKTTKLWATGGTHVGAYDDLLVSVSPTVLPPGGICEVIATPVDAVGNTLQTFPDSAFPPVSIEHHEKTYELKRRQGGYLAAQVTAPLSSGLHVVKVGTRRVCVEVSGDMVVASQHVSAKVRGVTARLPSIMHSMELREASFRNTKAELAEALLDIDRLKARCEEARKLRDEDLHAQEESLSLEKEAMGARLTELKNKLTSERNEQRQLQQRWDAREEGIEEERRQRAEDRRQWLEERTRLTLIEEENGASVAALRQQVSELQAKLKNMSHSTQRRLTDQMDETRATLDAEQRRWDAERASLEARYITAMERADEYKMEADTERNRVEQHTFRIEELDETIASMKTTLQEINVQRQRLEQQLRRADEERNETVSVSERRVEENVRQTQHSITVLKHTHTEEVLTLRTQITAAQESAEERLSQVVAEMDEKRATAVSQVQSAKLALMQEKEALQQNIEELETKLRSGHRDTQTLQEDHDVAVRLWDTERRSLERRLEEAGHTIREVEQRHIAEEESTRSLLEQDRVSWTKEKRGLMERISQTQEDMNEMQRQQDMELSNERATAETERTQWDRDRTELIASNTKAKERHDEATRQLTRLLEEEKLVNDDERRQWTAERAQLKARINDLQMQLDEALRASNRVSDEVMQEISIEREEWTTRLASLEAEIQEARATSHEAATRHKEETRSLKHNADMEKKRHTDAYETVQQSLEAKDEEIAVEKRRASRELQLLHEDFEVEREKYKMKCVSMRQEVENAQAEVEDIHSRHALKNEETEQERLRWAQEQALLREKLNQLEQGAAELAQEHQAQLADHDKAMSKARKEAETSYLSKASQLEASYMQRLEQEMAALASSHAEATAEWEAEQKRLQEAHRAELERAQSGASEREAMADSFLETARENFNQEIARYEAQLAKLQAEKAGWRQRAESDRAEERQRTRQDHQQTIEAHEKERQEWEEARDRMLKLNDELKATHQREINGMNRQLQRAGLEEAEAQQEEARREMSALREAWQTQLGATTDAHEKDRASFAKEREEWRAERAKLWSERNTCKQSLEAAVAETCAVREESEVTSTQQTEEIARFVDRIAHLENNLEVATRRLESKVVTDQSLLDSERDEWRKEREELTTQAETLRASLERQQTERRRMQQEMEELLRQSDTDRAGTVERLQQRHEDVVTELDNARLETQKTHKENARLSVENEDLRKRLVDSAGQTKAELEAQRSVSETVHHTLRQEREDVRDEMAAARKRIAELETAVDRVNTDAGRERQHQLDEYEQLRESFTHLQRQYTDQMQRNAKEAQDLRERGSEMESRWLEKESVWAEAMEQARKRAGKDASEFDDKLDSAIHSMDTQMKETNQELRRTRDDLREAQAQAARTTREKEDAEVYQRDKHDTEKQAWDSDRSHMAQQIERYKRLVDEAQENRQDSGRDVLRERREWDQERTKAQEEANVLRRQVAVCPTLLLPHPTPTPTYRSYRTNSAQQSSTPQHCTALTAPKARPRSRRSTN